MARTERSGHTTTDHDFIRGWVEERGGWPARVAGTEGGNDDAGLIRIDFPGYSGEGSLERIEWEEWFQKFDESELAFLHRDLSHGGGDLDRFNKLVRRGSEDSGESSRGRSGRGSAGKSAGGGRARSSSSSSGSSSRSSGAKRATAAETSSSSRSGSGSKSGGSKSSGGKSSGGASKSSGSKSSGASAKSARTSGASKSSGAATKSSGASKSSGGSKSSGSKSATSKSGGSKSAGAASKRAASSRAAAETRAPQRNGGDGGELRELLKHELGDLLFAEKVFLKGTKTLAKEAQNPMIKQRVEEHVRETEGHIERLQEAFRAIGERPQAEKCEAALGLQEEHDSFKSDEKPSKLLLSAFDLGSGLRVEHYEIAGYRSAIALATALGERECAGILKENLNEELAMASFLEKNSLAVLREMARA